MLTMVHTNLARLADGVLYVDRKFHTGMQEYLAQLDVPILSIHPYLTESQDASVMDLVAVPERELGYRVLTVALDSHGQIAPADRPKVLEAVRASLLVYGGTNGTLAMAKQLGIPVVAILEYNLKTTLVFAAAGVESPLRRAIKCAGACRYYVGSVVPLMRDSALLHCNGYPIYQEAAWFNPNRLLYFDSRISTDMLISEGELDERLHRRVSRKPRFLFSGRFEPAKGALEAVLVGAECHRRGLDFEMHLYGQGSQRAAMEHAVERHGLGAKVFLHDAVPYPELLSIARGCDAFVCCHIQDDPSCTYLESLGCGLPIVGYGNRMWRSMCAHSKAGLSVERSPAAMAGSLIGLVRDPDAVERMSRNARCFAADHTIDSEFRRRTDSLRELYRDGAAPHVRRTRPATRRGGRVWPPTRYESRR